MISEKCPWVTIEKALDPTVPHWEVKEVRYRDDTTEPATDMSANIYVQTLDAAGKPLMGVRVKQAWTDDTAEKYTDVNGKCDFIMSGDSSFSPDRGEHGPYSVYVLDSNYPANILTPTDTVHGLGLPLKRHVNYDITFQRVASPTQPVPPVPPVPPVTQTLEQAAQARADAAKPWLAINNTAALWLAAKQLNLQDAQSDELPFTYKGEKYIAQVFNKGIVYCPENNVNEVKVIRK